MAASPWRGEAGRRDPESCQKMVHRVGASSSPVRVTRRIFTGIDADAGAVACELLLPRREHKKACGGAVRAVLDVSAEPESPHELDKLHSAISSCGPRAKSTHEAKEHARGTLGS